MVSKRPDGYHNLETVFYPIQLSDALEMVESKEEVLTTSGIFVDSQPEDNLVMKALHLLKKDFDLLHVQFHLHKNIPFGAGLGGGSSDAAFTLKMLNDYFSLRLNNEELKSYASQLGADCPFFIDNKPSFATGTGEQLQPIEFDLSNYKIVILKPAFSVSTSEAYKNITPQIPDFNLADLNRLPIEEWKNTVINDFEKSVFPIYPEIKTLKEMLYKLGAVYASMSGSGSAVFGIFRHLPAELKQAFSEDYFLYTI